MKRKRHTEEQIIAILKEHEAGMKTADLCRKHGISEASFYNWKAKYGGLEVSADGGACNGCPSTCSPSLDQAAGLFAGSCG